MLEIFQYGFAVRGLEAGIMIAIIAPLIGIFLVLRRYSLIADTLAHVSLAGIALGLLLKISPIVTSLIVTIISSLGIEKLRNSNKIYGESALALFLSGSLAIATILLSLGKGFNTNLFNYLFGSIVTVTEMDLYTIALLGAVVLVVLFLFYKELLFITFDEVSAQVSGVPVKTINTILILLSAVTIAIAIPIIGVLLISALIVIPAISALQLKQSFIKTILYAEMISIFSVVTGIFGSFYLNLSTGGSIVILMLIIFVIILVCKPAQS